MSVRQRTQRYANGKSCVRWIVDIEFRHDDGKVSRIKRVPRVQSRAGAERLERELLHQLETGRFGIHEKVVEVTTLAEFWPTFFHTHVVVNNKPSEQATKQRLFLQHLLPRFGALKLNAITVHDIERFKAVMVQLGYKPKTINNQLTVLRTVLKTAVRWGAAPSCAEVKLLRSPLPEVTYLSFEQANTLVQAAGAAWGPMVITALNTGLRIGELIALHWSDVYLDRGLLRVTRSSWQGILGTPKSGRNRDVPLNQAVQRTLSLLAMARLGERVFVNEAGEPRTYSSCSHALNLICRRNKLQVVGWHALRHTFASHLVMKGVPLKAVQELLGHGTQAMTERYAHLTPDVRRQAVAVLDSDVVQKWSYSGTEKLFIGESDCIAP